MERSLHRQLKERYGLDIGGRSEVVFGQFRVDALTPDGRLVEIQSSPLGLLRPKLDCLIPTMAVDVIKPVIVTRRVIRRESADGDDLSSRRSPKRGTMLDVFEDLVGLAKLFPHPNLRIEIVAVDVDEIRISRRRRPGFTIVDRILREVIDTVRLEFASDLWALLPADLPDRFTTEDLARAIGRSIPFSQRVAYCLRHSGAVDVVGKVGNRRIYQRTDGDFSGLVGPMGRTRLEIPGRVR